MNYLTFATSILLILFTFQPAKAEWFSQTKEDAFGENHIIGALTIKFGKGLIVRCVGGTRLELMFLPNEMGSEDVVKTANLVGTTIKVRIDKESIDELKANVQLSDGKIIAIADLDPSIAARMAKARRRIAAVLVIMSNQFGSTNFGVRGSKRNINKALKACSSIQSKIISQNDGSFRAINKLKKSYWTNPADGNRVINYVKEQLKLKSYHDKIVSMTVESVRKPHKTSVEFILNDRLSETELAEISQAVRDGAGNGFKRHFVGFRLEGDNSGYWATAHHDPKLKVKIIGITAVEYDALVDRVKNYKASNDEKIIADAILSHGFTYHVVILNKNKSIIQRRYHHNGEEWNASGKKLLSKDGRYWMNNNDFKEHYRIHKGMLELHDKDGLITKGKIIKR